MLFVKMKQYEDINTQVTVYQWGVLIVPGWFHQSSRCSWMIVWMSFWLLVTPPRTFPDFRPTWSSKRWHVKGIAPCHHTKQFKNNSCFLKHLYLFSTSMEIIFHPFQFAFDVTSSTGTRRPSSVSSCCQKHQQCLTAVRGL